MREPYGPQDPGETPRGREPFATPAGYVLHGATEQAIYLTLHEIQHEQGRHDERLTTLLLATTALTNKVDALTGQVASMDRTVQDLAPKVERWDDTYKKALGAAWACGILLFVVGGLLYYTNAARLDKLIKVLDSPGIEKVLKKDGR